MATALRFALPLLVLAALAAALASFSPLPLADFDRFTLRVVTIVALLLAFVAHEARIIVAGR